MIGESTTLGGRVKDAITTVARGELSRVSFSIDPEAALAGYRAGRYPSPRRLLPVGTPWFLPRQRAVLEPRLVHVQKNVRRRMRNAGWQSSLDEVFTRVMARCADRPQTWLTEPIQSMFLALQEQGAAHSLEIWDGDGQLVGGLFGVRVGGILGVESMFHTRGDESKVAIADYAERVDAAGGRLIDLHSITPHLTSLGAVERPSAEFLDLLDTCRDDDVMLDPSRRPVADLLPWVDGLALREPAPPTRPRQEG